MSLLYHRCLRIFLVLISSFFTLPTVHAVDYTWIGTGSNGNWGDPLNWQAPNFNPPTNGVNTDIFLEGSDSSPDIQSITGSDLDFSISSITLAPGYVSSSGDLALSGGELTIRDEVINNEDSAELQFDTIVRMDGLNGLNVRANSAGVDFNQAVDLQLNEQVIDVLGGSYVYFDGGITDSQNFITEATLNIWDGSFARIRTSTVLSDIAIIDGTLQINATNALSADTNVNVSGDGTFQLNNNNTNIDVLTGSGSVQLGSGTLTLGENASEDASFTFFGVISGAGGISKNQSGETILAGSNTYTGTTTVSNGTLKLEGSGRISNSSDVVVNGGTFDLNGVNDTIDSISGAGTIRLGGGILTVDETSGTKTFSGNILESGELQKNGAGTLILSGNNTFTLLDINGGTVQVSSSDNLGDGTLEMSGGILNTTASFSTSIGVNTNSANSTWNVNNATTFTQSGVISGSGGLIKAGNGTMVLSGSNTYSGVTRINDGTLRLGASNRISGASDVVLVTGGTLDLDNFSDTVDSLSGTGGNVITGGSSGRLSVDASSGTFTYSGFITGSGGYTKAGNHTQVFTTALSYSGSTNINDGLVRFSGSGSFSSSTDVSVAAGATWDLNGLNDTVDSISGGGSIQLGGASLVVDENSGSTRTFSGSISEAGSLTKGGTHRLVLSGINNYTGNTVITGGTLQVASNDNLGAGSIIFSGSSTLNTTGTFANTRSIHINPNGNATIEVNSGTSFIHSGILSGDATTTLFKNGTGTLNTTGANAPSFLGDIVINAGTFDFGGGGDGLANSTAVTVNASGTFLVNNPDNIGGLSGSGSTILNTTLRAGADGSSTTYSGVISGTGLLGKLGSGVMTLSGNNTYTGDTDIDAGTLRLSGNGRISNVSDVSIASGSTFDLNGVSDTVDSLDGNGSVTLGGGTLTVGGNNGSGTFTGNISESGAFAKTGTGIQTLGGSNSWTNGTQINGGTLRLTGSTGTVLGSGTISINGATLETTTSHTNFKSISLGSSGGTVNVDNLTTLTMGAGTPITGTGSLTKTDNGTIRISTNSTYSGDTFIDDGTVQLINSGSLPNSTDVVVASGAIWDLNNISDTVKSLSGLGAVRLGSGTLTVTQDGGTLTYNGNILNTGGLVKNGTHTLRLGGLNDYSGPTTINEGTIEITEDFHLGDPASDVIFGGGTLFVASSAVNFNAGRSITLNAAGGTIFLEGSASLSIPGVISGSGTLSLEADNENTFTLSGINTYSGGTSIVGSFVDISQNSNLGSNSGTVTMNEGFIATDDTFTNLHPISLNGGTSGFSINGSTLTQSAPISGTGDLLISGTGTLLLTEPASHAGTTRITSNATLEFGSGALPDTFNVEVEGNWDLNGVDDTIGGLDGEGTVTLDGATLTVGGGNSNGNFCGLIQGVGALVKTGQGTQILDGTNTYTTNTTINQGTLEVTGDGALGASGASLVFNEGVLRTASSFSTGRDTFINFVGEFEVTNGSVLTYTSPIEGGANADLVKSGDGTLVLTQANTFGGLTEIKAGTIQLTGSGALPSSPVDIFAGATLDSTDVSDTIGSLGDFGNVLLGTGTLTLGADNGNRTFGGVISGIGGAVVKTGTGTQTFAGVNTYTGGTYMNDGVLKVSQNLNLGESGSILSFDGGTLNTTASFITTRGISVEAGGGTIDVEDGTILDAKGNITSLGSLTKVGSGELLLSGFSTYLGGTTIDDGVVEISSAVNLGSTSGPLTINNGTLRTSGNIITSRATEVGNSNSTIEVVGGTTLTQDGVVSGTGNLIKEGAGLLILNANNTYSGRTIIVDGVVRVSSSDQLGDGSSTNDLQINGGTINTTATFTNARDVFVLPGTGAFDVDSSTTLTLSGVVANIIPLLPGDLNKSGGGILLLTASNTYGGGTNINSGTIRLSGSGQLPDTTDVSIANSAFLDLNDTSDTINGLSGSGDVLLGSATFTIGSNDGGGSYSGTISGTGGIIKVGTGAQTFRTKTAGEDRFPSTYLGGTEINGGILDVEEDENLGDATGTLSFDGGTLQVGGENSVNSTRLVTLNSGGGTLAANGVDASMNFGGVISGDGFLQKTGTGTLTLSASNTYTGNTNLLAGLTRLEGAGRLPDASYLTVEASGTAQDPGGLDLNNISDAVDGLEGNGDINLGSGTLTIGSNNSGGDWSGQIEGTGGVTKVGAGYQIFNGTGDYSGGTSINGGILEIFANSHLGDPAGALRFDSGSLRVAGTFTMQRPTTLNAGGGTIEVFGSNTLTHSAPLTGAGGLTKIGGGTLLLTSVSTYGGPTIIEDGTLRLSGNERLANVTDVAVAAGATFDLDGNSESIDSLSGAGLVQLGAAQLILGLDDGSGIFSGVISGTGDLLKEGAGIQTLTGNNTFSGATFADRGELVLSAGGTIDQTTLAIGFNIGSDGIVTIDGSSTTWDLTGNLFVGFDGNGRLNINNGATLTADGDISIGSMGVPGTISLDGGAIDTLAGNPLTIAMGSLEGSGTVIGDVFNQDTIAPGLSAGILNFNGNYSQDTSATFSVEVGGTDNSDPQNPQFDVLNVTGTAGLTGDLELALIPGFTPQSTDTFVILSAGALGGSFVNAPNGARLSIVSGGTGSFQVNYIGNQVVLSDFMGSGIIGLAGDYNDDNIVDLADYTVWRNKLGSSDPLPNDDIGGVIGQAQYNQWKDNYGATSPVFSSANSSVPEPASVVLLAIAFVAMTIKGIGHQYMSKY